MFYRRCLKPFLDRTLAGLGLLVLSPVIATVALIVRLRLGSPALFRQQRIGRNNTSFLFYKFRSMTGARDSRGNLLPDAERLTPVGRFLRATSLDELPQLWNVFRGDMSLIGPRPLLPQYLPRYSMKQRRRHEVTPGITGLAQTQGRNSLSWDEKFDLDVWYVDHVSLRLDLRILAATFAAVIGSKGIASAGHATMPEFMGSSRESADQ